MSFRKKIFILVISGILFLVICLLPFFINGISRYHFDGNDVYFGSKKLINFNVRQYKSLSPTIIKDSSNVFYKGKILEWADAATFISLGNDIFKDKNGLYYEAMGMYAIHNVIPVKGTYDLNTFRQVDGYIYKDKKRLYVCNNNHFSLFRVKKPLKEINIPGIEIDSFNKIVFDKGVTSLEWYTDKKQVYFVIMGEIRARPEIDLPTFEMIDFRIYKDKNHVYYNRQLLRSHKNEQASRYADYRILEGADGSTFRLIKENDSKFDMFEDTKLFEDRNGVWEIARIRNGRNSAVKVLQRKK